MTGYCCEKNKAGWGCNCPKPTKADSQIGGLLYGVVEWLDGNLVLDGMPYFECKKAALKYATEREKMGNMGLPCNVEYRVIRLKKAK